MVATSTSGQHKSKSIEKRLKQHKKGQRRLIRGGAGFVVTEVEQEVEEEGGGWQLLVGCRL